MREVKTHIDIQAPVSIVWDLIFNIEGYGRWNPFVVMGRGVPEKGKKIIVRAEPRPGRGMTFSPRVTALVPERELRWVGHFLLPGLVDGEHIHVLEPLADGRVRYQHDERFSGLLVPIVWPRLEKVTRKGFERMNRAVKDMAEKNF